MMTRGTMNGRLTLQNVNEVLGQNGPHKLIVHPCLVIQGWSIAGVPLEGNIWYVVSDKDLLATGHGDCVTQFPWKLLDHNGAVIYESDGSPNEADRRHDRARRRKGVARSRWDRCRRRRPQLG